MEADEPAQCRICLESGGELLTPCDCKGTARFVHAACVAEWQASQQERRGSAHRSTRCDICGAKYRGLPRPPPRPRLVVWREHFDDYLSTCRSIRWFCASSAARQYMFVLCVLFNLVDGRWRTAERWVAAWELFEYCALAAAVWSLVLHVFLVRNNLRFAWNGATEGMRIIRFGAPVEGLDAGSLLVFLRGTREDGEGPFDNTVLYVTEHDDERGSTAIVLNRPMFGSGASPRAAQPASAERGPAAPLPRGDSSEAGQTATAQRQRGRPLPMELRYGGPVAKEAWHVFHTMGPTVIAGSRKIFPPPSIGAASVTRGSRDGDGSASASPGDPAAPLPIYLAECSSPHSLYDLPETAVKEAAANGGMLALASGIAAWAPGQLAGEVRCGSWGWVEPRFQKRRWFGMTCDAEEVQSLWLDVAESPFIEVCLPGVRA
jgi:putative AlgH/UPF0301 family transcriptional regulator